MYLYKNHLSLNPHSTSVWNYPYQWHKEAMKSVVVSNCLHLQWLTRLQRETTVASPPPKKRMYEASILLNDLLEAAAHFNESIQKHKLDCTNCCGGHTQQLIKIVQHFYSYRSSFRLWEFFPILYFNLETELEKKEFVNL